jgi:hypothetical protein
MRFWEVPIKEKRSGEDWGKGRKQNRCHGHTPGVNSQNSRIQQFVLINIDIHHQGICNYFLLLYNSCIVFLIYICLRYKFSRD